MGVKVSPKLVQAAKESYEQLSNIGLREELLEPFDDLIKTCEDILHEEAIRKEKQKIGIREAQQNGICIGRPPVPVSKRFLKLEHLYSKKMITAREAAERLDIAVSTFYKVRKRYRREIEEWKWSVKLSVDWGKCQEDT